MLRNVYKEAGLQEEKEVLRKDSSKRQIVVKS